MLSEEDRPKANPPLSKHPYKFNDRRPEDTYQMIFFQFSS